jgi:CBS domain containing-hemolysin-like protein
VNGIGQSLTSLGRFIGPIAFSYMFAWSENNNAPYPFNYFLCFIVLAILSVANAWMSTLLPKSIQRFIQSTEYFLTGMSCVD